MKNFFKKLFKNPATSIALAVAFIMSSSFLQASTVSSSVATLSVSNLSLALGTGGKITQIIVTSSPTNTSSSVYFFDTTYTGLTNGYGAYTNITSYASNAWYAIYTNYYGRTNNLTNIVLFDVTNTVAGAVTALNPLIVLSGGSNSTVTYQGLSIPFNNGITVSNSSLNWINTTITYTQ